MRLDAVLDTGPLVALLSKRDAAHAACLAAFESYKGVFATSEAVLTEATYLLRRVKDGPPTCINFFLRGAAWIFPADERLLTRCHTLTKQYANLPMDYADACLVALADALRLDQVFTTDRRGFRTYRGARGARFQLLPG